MDRGIGVEDDLEMHVRAGLALAHDQLAALGRLGPMHPAQAVTPHVGTDPQEITRMSGTVQVDRALARPVAGGGLRHRPELE